MYGRIYDPGMKPYPRQVALALYTNARLGFHAVRAGINLPPRFAVVDVWKDF